MDLHKNARLSLRSREGLVTKVIEEKQTLKAAAAAFQRAPENSGQVGGALSS